MARSNGAIEVFASAPAAAPDTKLTITAKLLLMSGIIEMVIDQNSRRGNHLEYFLLGSVLWKFVLNLSEVLLESVLPSVIISVAFLWTTTFPSPLPLTPKMLGLLDFIDVTDDLESLTKWFILNDRK